MKIKKIVLASALTCGASMVLASCGTSAKPDFVMPEEGLTTEPITIEFWHTMGKDIQAILEEQIVEFNKCFPNITVEHKQIGGYPDVRDQIQQNFTTGAYPTLAYCYPDHVALYNEAEITVKLDELENDAKYGMGGSALVEAFANAEVTPVKKSDMINTYFSEGTCYGDGHRYTLPFVKSTELMFYNKTFFEENHLTVPETWDEMWATCEAIKKIDPNAVPLGYDSEDNMFITMAETYGYPYTSTNEFLFNNEGMRTLMKNLREKYDKGYLKTRGTNGNQYTSNVFVDSTINNRMYMCIGSSAGASHQSATGKAFEVGVTHIPGATKETAKQISQGPSLVLLKNEDPQKVLATWLFANFLLTDFCQASIALGTGYLPVTKTAVALPAYQEKLAGADGYDQLAKLSAQYANSVVGDNVFASPVFIGSSIARDQVGSIVRQVLQDAEITSSNIDSKVLGYFEAAINKCKYESGL